MKRQKNNLGNKGITLIALVITIIVLLILAGVSIAMLTGENGILTKANEAKIEQSHAAVVEAISLKYSEYQIEKNNPETNTNVEFITYLGECVDSSSKNINVEQLVGENQALGNGTGDTDVYKLIEDSNMYILQYYDEEGTLSESNLWSVAKTSTASNVKTITIKNDQNYEGITDMTIQYEEGMTWEQFISSEYNTNNSIISDEYDRVVPAQNTECLVSSDSETDEYGRDESVDDVIDSSRNYFFVVPR